MKQLEVQIMGQNYVLGCPDGADARLLDAVERLDTAMCQIRESGKVRARDRIAVLAALNLTFDTPQRGISENPVGASAAASPSTAPDPRLSALLVRLDEALGADSALF